MGWDACMLCGGSGAPRTANTLVPRRGPSFPPPRASSWIPVRTPASSRIPARTPASSRIPRAARRRYRAVVHRLVSDPELGSASTLGETEAGEAGSPGGAKESPGGGIGGVQMWRSGAGSGDLTGRGVGSGGQMKRGVGSAVGQLKRAGVGSSSAEQMSETLRGVGSVEQLRRGKAGVEMHSFGVTRDSSANSDDSSDPTREVQGSAIRC